jgi:mono/diheme cytochrome c family protein
MIRSITWWGLAVFASAVIGTAQGTGWSVPDEYKAMKSPIPASAEAAAAGQDLYVSKCQKCHGEKGEGDGPAAKFLRPVPPNIITADQQRMTDGELFYKITEGKSPMPPMKEQLSEPERWQLVQFVRRLQHR